MATDHNFKVKNGLVVEGGEIYVQGTTTPQIYFNGSADSGIDMAIKATPESLDFYEPEEANRLHMRIVDDAGVNAVFGFRTGVNDGTLRIDGSGNLTNIGTISSGAITSTGNMSLTGELDITKSNSLHSLILGNRDGFADSSDDALIWITSGNGTFKNGQGAHLVFEGRKSNRNFYFKVGNVTAPQHIMHSNGYAGFGTGDITPTDRVHVDGTVRATSYKVGTTPIIDSSRNLTSIGTISSGSITSSGTLNFTSAANPLISSQYGEVLWHDDQFSQDLIKQVFASGIGDYLQLKAGGNGSNVEHKFGETYADLGGYLKIDGTTRIDSSGNATLGALSAASLASGTIDISEGVNSGDLLVFKKGDSTVIGKIRYTAGDNISIYGTIANHAGINFGTNIIVPMSAGVEVDNKVELGDGTRNMKAVHTKSIKVANVEVLDASRNLTNIGTYSGSGTLTITKPQVTSNFATTPAIRVHPSSTTSSGGRSALFLGTSTIDNYGISLRGARLGTNGNPTFEVAIHQNSGNGLVALSIDTNRNATFNGAISSGAITTSAALQVQYSGTNNISLSPTSTGGVINARNSSGTSVVVMDGRGTPFIDVTGNLKTGGTTRIDSSGNLSNIGTITATGQMTLADAGYSIGNELHVWKRDYVVNNTSPKDLLYQDGSALPNGGAYRVQAHIPGTGTDQSATAVFWNQNGTWKVNATYQSGTSSNHPEFIVGSNGKPQIHIDHTSNYAISILHERLELGESTGTDNKSGFGADGYLSEVLGVLRHNPYGGSDFSAGNRIFADNYHPNANKWTTARSHTVTLTGEVTGTATQSVDGTGDKTWTISTTLGNTALDDQYVDITGDTMTGTLNMNSNNIQNARLSGAQTYLPGHAYSLTHDGSNVYWHIGSASGNTNKVLNLRIYNSSNNYSVNQWTIDRLTVAGGVTTTADIIAKNSSHIIIGQYSTTDTGSLILTGSTANKQAILKCTNGNLHIDSNAGNATYINYYNGSGTYFGTGAGGVAAVMGPDGDLWKGSADNTGNRYFHDGYHPNADKWTTPRSHTVTLTGEVTGTATQSVDGTGNKTWSIGTTLNHNSLNDQYVQVLPRHNADGDSLVVQSKASITIWDVSGASDDPSGASDGLVLSAGWDSSSWGIQQFHDFHTNDLYLRSKQNGTMSSWDKVFHDTYHPNADKWTTARSHTVTLTGEVTGTATQSVDGTGNKTWSIATTLNNTALDDQYVDVTGDTMTGNLTIGTTTDSTKLVFPDKNVLDNPTAAGNKRQLIGMGNSGAGGMWQTTGRGGLMLASADDSLILASGDIARGYDPDAGTWNPNPDDEDIYLLTDGSIRFRTNLQTASAYKQMSFDANGDLTVSRNITAGGTITSTGNITSSGTITASGTITSTSNMQHTGLTMTSGTDIDQLYTVTDSLTLTTSYQDTSINGSELATGTYIMQLYVAGDHSVGGSHYNEFYSGVISWYGSATNSTEVDEIVLHRAGHAPNASVIHLRTQRHASGGDNLVLQIKGNYNMTAARNYVFKFRRMI